MSRADIAAGNAYVTLFVKDDPLTAGLNRARQRVSEFGASLQSMGVKAAGIGASILAPIGATVSAASRYEQAFSKFNIVFGSNATEVKQWGDSFAKQVGRSKTQMVEFLAAAQDTFIPLGFEPGEAEAMSKQLTTLAVDLASFNNMGDEEAFNRLLSSVVGNTENLKLFGVVAQEAQIKAQALTMGFDPKNLTPYEKALAIMQITMKGTAQAQDNATTTSGEFANQMKRLQGTITDLSAEAGTGLLGVLSKLSSHLSDTIVSLSEWVKKNQELVFAAAMAGTAFVTMGASLIAIGTSLRVASVAVSAFQSAASVAGTALSLAWSAAGVALTLLTLKSRITVAIIQTAWSAAAKVVSAAWTVAMGLINVGIQGVFASMSAVAIAAPFIAGAAAIAVAYFGLDAVLGALAVAASAAWGASAGFIATAWTTAAGLMAPLAAAVGGAWSIAGGLTSAVWAGVAAALSGAGIAGVASAVATTGAWAIFSQLGIVVAAEQSLAAAVTSAAWAAAAGLASLAWSGFTAVLSAALAPSFLLSAASFVVSAAWTSAAALITAAWSTTWAIITSPIMPFIVAAGAVAAAIGTITVAAGIAAVRGMDFAGAWGNVQSALLGALAVVKEVSGTIMAALSAGRYVDAATALWLGLKIAFYEGIQGVVASINFLVSEGWELIKRFFTELLTRSFAVVKALAKALVNPIGAAGDLANAISRLNGATVSLDFRANADEARSQLAALRAQLDGLNAGDGRSLEDLVSSGELTQQQADAIQKQREVDKANQGIDALEKSGALSAEEAAAAKQANAAKLLSDGAPAQANEAADAFQRESDALQEQIVSMQQGADAAERMRLAKLNLNEEQITAIENLRRERDAIKEATEAEKERMDARVAAIAEKGDQLLARGVNPDEIMRRERAQVATDLAAGRIDQETADRANEDLEKRRLARRKQLEAEGQRIAERLRSPQEILNEKMRKINQLQTTGAISDQVALRAEDEARKQFQDATARDVGTVDTPQARNPTFVSSSAAALTAIGGSPISSPTLSELKLIRTAIQEDAKARRAAEAAQLRATEEGGGIAVG